MTRLGRWFRLPRSTFGRRAVSSALVVGLAAISAIDVLVVTDRHHSAARTHAAHEHVITDELAYLSEVRAIADHVRTDAMPVQHLLDLISSGHDLDIYAVRDALANDEPRAALAADLRHLDKLQPPTVWAAHQRGLHHGLAEMVAAVQSMKSHRSERNPALLHSHLAYGDGLTMDTAESDWQTALTGLFPLRHQKAPAVVVTGFAGHPPVSLVGWTYAADSRCLLGIVHGEPLLTELDRNHSDVTALHKLAAVIRTTSQRLRDLKLPAQPRWLRREVWFRLSAGVAEAVAIDQIATSVQHGDPAKLGLALQHLKSVEGTLTTIGRGFARVHAVSCVNFFGGSASPKHHAVAA